ncbi:MAG: virulence RhuM family protein [Salinivirgaceae bacterium]|nr:virulence RhuM family protein [Salinivirgaceae bacterium]MBR7034322.1 virulence RhuM family protein [Bacteroidales bacterium]
MTRNEIILYQPDDAVKLEVRLSEETVWLTQQQMTVLFETTKQNISLHINNIFREKELDKNSVVKDYLTTAADGKKYRTQYYNLDVIISVGYRVKSQRGTQFRIWATGILKDYLLRGYALNNRLANIEGQLETQQKILEEHSNKIDFFVRTSLPPVEGIFYDGQMLEPFAFVNNLIRSARKRIVLIDNYVDETVLLRLAERAKNVTAKIYTQQTSPSLNVALAQHNNQYEPIDLCIFTKSHDRFLIIDNDVYHIGASIKDLGKRWFAFCKMQLQADEMITKLI